MNTIEMEEEMKLARVWGNVLWETGPGGVTGIGIVGLDEDPALFTIASNRHAQGAPGAAGER